MKERFKPRMDKYTIGYTGHLQKAGAQIKSRSQGLHEELSTTNLTRLWAGQPQCQVWLRTSLTTCTKKPCQTTSCQATLASCHRTISSSRNAIHRLFLRLASIQNTCHRTISQTCCIINED